MQKLELDSIKLLGEGHQIRSYILEHFGSVDQFYSTYELPVSLKSVRTYLSQDKITSDTFRHALVRALDVDYHEIVQSKAEQLKRYVQQVFEDIRLYNEDGDLLVIDTLLGLCKEYALSVETSMMYRSKAEYFFKRNKTIAAIELFEEAIKVIGVIDINHLTLYIIELADLYYREGMLLKAEHEYSKAEKYISSSQLNPRVLFKYNYWRGIMYNNTSRYIEARLLFEKAAEYSNDKKEKAASLMNIGLSYKKEKAYDKALHQYESLLEYYSDEEFIGRGTLYNNIATILIEQGKPEEALSNAVKAVALASLSGQFECYFTFTHTFVHVNILMGKTYTCIDFLKLLKKTLENQLDRKYVVQAINNIIEVVNDISYLNALDATILELIEGINNQDYIRELYILLGKLHEKITRLNKGGI